MPVRVAWATDPGLARAANEDAVVVLLEGVGAEAMLIVADGMGGHAAGQLASKIAAETVADQLVSDDGSGPDPTRLLVALDRANRAVFDAAQEVPERMGMGSTLVVAAVDRGRVAVINVGDSPAYLFHEGELTLITEDHSWPAEQARLGLISVEEARDHPMKHRLTRAIGIWERVKNYSAEAEMAIGDMLVLCSDGVEAAGVTPEEVYQLLTLAGEDLAAGVRSIIDRCRHLGAPDNVTVAVAQQVAESGQAPARRPVGRVRKSKAPKPGLTASSQ